LSAKKSIHDAEGFKFKIGSLQIVYNLD